MTLEEMFPALPTEGAPAPVPAHAHAPAPAPATACVFYNLEAFFLPFHHGENRVYFHKIKSIFTPVKRSIPSI